MTTSKPFLAVTVCALVAVLWPLPGSIVCGASSASIQATAHVEAPLGLTDAFVVKGERNENMAPGSHLYWLYYPHRDGVVIQLSGAKRASVTPLLPEIRREYARVSLVTLPEQMLAAQSGSDNVTLTVIFTDN